MHGFLLCATAGRRDKMLPTTPHTQPLPGITCIRFGLIRFRSPLLSESLLFSLPVGTEMFHFPTFPPHTLYIQARVTGHDSSQVSPFGHPRITARLPTPQGLSQAPTSFIGSRCQGIHHVPFIACHNTHTNSATQSKPRHHCERTKHHTTPATPTTPPPTNRAGNSRIHACSWHNKLLQRCSRPLWKSQTTHPDTRNPPHPTDQPKPRHRTTQPPRHPPQTEHDEAWRLILQNPNSVPPTYSPTQTPVVTRAAPQAPPSRETREDPPRPNESGPGRTQATDGWVSMVPLVSNPGRHHERAPRPGEHPPPRRRGRAVDCSLERR